MIAFCSPHGEQNKMFRGIFHMDRGPW